MIRYRRYPQSCKSFVPKAPRAASIAAFRIVKSPGANPLLHELSSKFITEHYDIETKGCGKGLADEGDIRGGMDIIVVLVWWADLVYLDIQRTAPGSIGTRICTASGKSNSGYQGRYEGANHLDGIAPGQDQLSRGHVECFKFRILHSPDRCDSNQCQVFPITRHL